MAEHGAPFQSVNFTYWQMFSYSFLDVFLDEKPRGNSIIWRLKRLQNYFLLFFFFPFFLTTYALGTIYGREADLPQKSFDVSYISHLVRMITQMGCYLYYIKDMRCLCLKFESFNFSRHRPSYVEDILEKKSHFLKVLASICYTCLYLNLCFWLSRPLVINPVKFILAYLGYIQNEPDTIIPRFFPARYPFDEQDTNNRYFIAVIEFIQITAGLVYYIPVDQFLVSLVVMLCGASEALCTSIQTAQQLISEENKENQYKFGSEDDIERIDIKLFIEDHQRILK